MNVEDVRLYCLQKPGTTEHLPFGPDNLVIKVMDKMFALISLDANPLSLNLKCDPELALSLRENHSGVRPGYHMNKHHWNTVVADGSFSETALKQWIDHSYNLVVLGLPKKIQAILNSNA